MVCVRVGGLIADREVESVSGVKTAHADELGIRNKPLKACRTGPEPPKTFFPLQIIGRGRQGRSVAACQRRAVNSWSARASLALWHGLSGKA